MHSAQVVAVCDPLDRFERKLDLELARINSDDIVKQVRDFATNNYRQEMDGNGTVLYVKSARATECRSIYFAPAIRSWFLNFRSQVLFIEKDCSADSCGFPDCESPESLL